ncbi:MAG: oligopeptide/dipeptide ABC transporter ATP-binding protein [Clostridiaceae bacterium]|nr:oligopeptide/dipeptide ABC transporter ATP-binding protein [Clostridiaceae bacterium]
MERQPLIETVHLKKYFETPYGLLHAVDDINLKIYGGRTLGVVGESGCGKSTLGRVILRLIEATDGKVFFQGKNIFELNKHEYKKLKKSMQIIFQDPYSSLDPRFSVSELIAEPLLVTKAVKGREAVNRRVNELMDTVGLAQRLAVAYPHELDGGRRQRIGIARALAVNPQFIVCDEPVSALDVSIQAQILNLLMDLQKTLGLTYMFITHDLSVVKHISHDIAVMYLGQNVEWCTSDELFAHPLHPYTKALLSAIPLPRLNKKMTQKEVIHGELSSPVDPAPGCRFAVRCPECTDACVGKDIPLIEYTPGHFVACAKYL